MKRLGEIENLLKQRMGLDASSIGHGAIQRAVQHRMAARGLEEPADCWAGLLGDEAEIQALVEAAVVPETWFFRDKTIYTALSRLVPEQRLPRNPSGLLRVLSAPCSTGEEPYSIAMTLLESGLRAEQFAIDAVDISAEALAQAKAAVYGQNSFRGDDLRFRDRYFDSHSGKYELQKVIRDRVTFARANILDPNFSLNRAPYDVIFCRNLLIYFDRATQQQTMNLLERLLRNGGCLFLGASETSLVRSRQFLAVQFPRSFAFRKKIGEAGEPRRPVRATQSPPSAARSENRPRTNIFPVPAPARLASARGQQPEQNLELAGAFADQGRFAEAEQICESHLRQHGPSAQAFYLMGLVRDARGQQTMASDLYRKALYLEPNHYEVLIHLALVTEGRGDAAGAHAWRNRARRVMERWNPKAAIEPRMNANERE